MQPDAKTRESLLNKKQAAKKATISVRTLDSRMASGDVPYIKLGGVVRFRASDIDDWINSCRVGGAKNKGRKLGGGGP
jgi:predicted DNA-binding transcriptional regulator AlpA